MDTTQPPLAQQLIDERAYYRGLIEASLDGLVTVDPNLTITDVNEQMCRMSGYPRERLIGSLFPSYFTDPIRATQGVRLTLDTGAVTNYELTLRGRDGQGIQVSFNAAVFKDQQERVRGIFASARDVTERQRAEEAVSLEQQRFNSILERLPVYLVLITPDYQIALANRDFRERFGAPSGLRCYEHLFGRQQPCEKCRSFAVLQTGESVEWEWLGPDGRTYHVFDFPFTDTDGSTLILEMGMDITERKRAQERIQTLTSELELRVEQRTAQLAAANQELHVSEAILRETLREREVLLKEIHHRVKNNLQIIHSMLSLQSFYTMDEQVIELFNESKNRIYTMALIHEQLYQSESLRRLNLSDYIKNLVANLFLSYGVSELSVKPSISIEDVVLDADMVIPCALIINELVSNALKHAFPAHYRPEQKEIVVSLQRDAAGQFFLTVSDNGVGLPKDFDMQTCESLGLKVVDVLAKQLSGCVYVDSEDRTAFTVIF